MKTTSSIKADYIDHMGTDMSVVNAARVSFGESVHVVSEKDEKLLNYLAKHEHMSPFEHCQLTVLVECPLFIRSQIHRHRTFAYNEISRRYTDSGIEFFSPDTFRCQSLNNKQGSYGALPDETNEYLQAEGEHIMQECLIFYNKLLETGVGKEQARGYLPQNLMTKFYMTGNLRNWIHFLRLRLDNHAQKESQVVAQQIKNIISERFPASSEALFKYAIKEAK